ncbi:MAG TPA: hypothetical protein VFH95_15760 [Candidatus Kapabacteria bacterium]|nr:hypothetical protein [Candidatus Kapabacteria bacterium]
MTEQEPTKEQISIGATNASDLPKLYFNNFTIGYSPVDVMIRAAQNGMPIVEINLSFGVTKQLAFSLMAAIEEIEGLLDHPIEVAKKKEATP